MTTRDKILATALRLFSQKGYLGATTKEIARKAGIAEVTLFRQFASKEKLFEEVISAHSFLPALKGMMPEIMKMPYEEALESIAHRFLETLNERKDMIRIMNSEMQRYPEKIHKVYNAFIGEIYSALASFFDELQNKNVLIKFNSVLAARAFFGMFFSYFNVQEFLVRKKYDGGDTDMVIKEYVKIFARGTFNRDGTNKQA